MLKEPRSLNTAPLLLRGSYATALPYLFSDENDVYERTALVTHSGNLDSQG